ncbi:MAG: ferritin-like domain-containing protein [Gammaproteobacteria bacterium]|nr:ferritin-like domain-containing protein [Gammaproteobacteria bacterium]
MSQAEQTSFFLRVQQALLECDSAQKVKATHHLAKEVATLKLDHDRELPLVVDPGRPLRPELVVPRQLPKRKPNSIVGRATLYHAVAHIEFNAINLALDAAGRFRGLPDDYYYDWIGVAAEEAYHFTLIQAHLRLLGYDYGDFPAHNGLWEMALTSREDPLLRMALVPRYLEARGLDVNPGMAARLKQSGDDNGVSLLEIILRDEIGHVAVGDRWFRYLCQQRQLPPEESYRQLIARYTDNKSRPPYHFEARRAAGFSEEELSLLEGYQYPKTHNHSGA